MSETATSLAYEVEAVPPPPLLRDRILDQARAERPNVTPLRSRFVPAIAAAAAIAACAAIGFGIWSASLSQDLAREREAAQRSVNVLAEETKRIPVSGDHGLLFVAPTGQAALVVARLPGPPRGKTYQAWVIERGRPVSAGVFEVRGDPALVPLRKPVPDGALVAVTVERDGGSPVPTGSRVLTAQA